MDRTRKKKEQLFWDQKAGVYDERQARWQSMYDQWIRDIRSALRGGGTLLDMGCGTGIVTLGLADAVDHVSAYDISEPMLEDARRKSAASQVHNIIWRNGDVYALPEAAQSFDYCIGCALLDIVVDPLAVLKEAHRLIKPGGILITMTDSRFAYQHRTGVGHAGRVLLRQLGLRHFSGKPPLVAELYALHLAAGFSVSQVITRPTELGQVYSGIWAVKSAADRSD